MKALVLGGNGFIGNNLVRTLSRRGVEVWSFDLNIPIEKYEGVHYLAGDFFDDYVLEQTVQGMDLVYHAICTMNPGNSNDKYIMGYERDFIQSIKLCDMLKESGTRMIFLSSGGTVYGKQFIQPIKETALPVPINHYGNLKLAIEHVMQVFRYQNHSDFIIARVANPYGPGQDYRKGVGFVDAALRKALNGEVIEVWGDGNVVRDYIYIDDVCNILTYLGLRGSKYDVLNISNSRGISQEEILQIIRKYVPEMQVDYKPARSVDVDKIQLANERIMEIYKKDLMTMEKGIELYYHYLKEHM